MVSATEETVEPINQNMMKVHSSSEPEFTTLKKGNISRNLII